MKKVFSLTADTIDRVSDEIESVCNEFRTERKTMLRYRLAAEESLLIWQKELGEDTHVVFETGKRFGKPFFQISAIGKACNPYSSTSEDYGAGEKSMLVNIGLIPAYSYAGGGNTLTFRLKKKPLNPILFLVLVIGSAVAVGLIGKAAISPDLLANLTEGIIVPFEDTAFRILSCIAGPMIFLSVAWGVYGIGDVYTLGRVGKKLMLYFLGVVFLFSALGVLFYPFLGRGLTDSLLHNSQAGTILALLLDIFPSNIFSPFIEGNTLQIILLAFIIGLSMIFLGQRTSSVARAVEQINYIITFLMGFISKLVPFFIFIVLVRIIWSDSFAIFSTVWQFALVFLVAYVILLTGMLVVVGLRHRSSPLHLFRICLPSYMIALTTASSSATFESNITICKKKMGISDSFASFGVPFGMVLFKPNTALYYILMCFYFSTVYAVEVSVSWIVIAVIITAISAVATPPIPGGAAATYTILFSQLGIPTEALAIALAVDMLFDFFLTSGDMLALLLELFHVSRKIGMADKTAMVKVKK